VRWKSRSPCESGNFGGGQPIVKYTNCAKTPGMMEMSFVMWTMDSCGLQEPCVRRSPDPHTKERGNFEDKKGPPGTCPDMNGG